MLAATLCRGGDTITPLKPAFRVSDGWNLSDSPNKPFSGDIRPWAFIRARKTPIMPIKRQNHAISTKLGQTKNTMTGYH